MQHKFTQPNRQTFTKTAFSRSFILLTLLIAFALLFWSQPAAEAAKMYWTDLDRGISRSDLDGKSLDLLLAKVWWAQNIAVDAEKIYWTDRLSGKIQRANLDGTNIENIVTRGQELMYPWGISVDGIRGKIYWTDFDTGKIQRANLDGSNVEDMVTGLEHPTDIAVDATGGKIYWADDGTGKIQRANLDGSEVEDIIEGIGAITGLDIVDVNLKGIVVERGKIYWVEGLTDKIRRANLDGTDIEDIVTQVRASDIAVDADGGKIYWTEGGPPRIRRANLDGTDIEDIIEGISPLGIAVDGLRGKIYWTDLYHACASIIQRANLDGTNIENIVMGLCLPEGIAVDGLRGKIYWADWGLRKIQRANLDGSDAEDIVTLEAPQYAEGVAVDMIGENIYWTNNDGKIGKIQSANLDGSNIEDIVTGLNSPEGIAIDASRGKIYWTDSGTDKIQSAKLDGSNVENIVTGLNNPEGIAIDASRGKIYWVDTGTDTIQRANLDGSNIEDIVTQSSPWGITVDAGGEKIYWTSSTFVGDGKIQRANLDGTNIEDIATLLGSPGFIAFDFSTTAGTVTLLDEHPPLTWNYRLTHNSGTIEQWKYIGATITGASVDGEAAAAGWSVQSQTDTQVVFATTSALTSGELTGFHITGTTGGRGTWTAGSNSGNVDGPSDNPVFTGSMNGHVIDRNTGNPLRALVIAINYETQEKDRTVADSNGYYEMKDLEPGTYLVIAIKGGYRAGFAKVTVEAGKTTTQDFQLRPKSGEEDEGELIALSNFPNPFNPDTWIPYYLPQDADVTINIYNSAGQLVRTLNIGRQATGIYVTKDKAAYWDGCDSLGEKVSSGVYYYTLQAGKFRATRKMIITK